MQTTQADKACKFCEYQARDSPYRVNKLTKFWIFGLESEIPKYSPINVKFDLLLPAKFHDNRKPKIAQRWAQNTLKMHFWLWLCF